MRELRFYKDGVLCIDGRLIYDMEKDSDTEKAMWNVAAIFYDLQPGEELKVVCVR